MLNSLYEMQEYVTEYLASHPCVDCGCADEACLQFDHVRGTKCFAICDILRLKVTMEALIAELAKCEVRCANCHSKRHFPNGHQYLDPAAAQHVIMQVFGKRLKKRTKATKYLFRKIFVRGA